MSHWLTGRRPVPDHQIKRIAEVLGVDEGWLMGENPSTETDPSRIGPDDLDGADWTFRPAPEDGGRDYGNSNIFATPPDIGTFVRETAQNARDQALGEGAVHLRYSLIELKKGTEEYDAFVEALQFDELTAHIASAAKTQSKVGTRLQAGLEDVHASDKLMLLRIEDYGTTGLYGGEKSGGDPSPFAALVRNNLDSSKQSASAGGSFGLGKATLWRCSELSTVLFASDIAHGKRRATDRGFRFVGKAELTWHQLGDVEFAGPGWLSDSSANSMWMTPDKLAPVFLNRTSTPPGVSTGNASGTSILVVGFRDPKADATSDPKNLVREIKEAAAQNFWPAIVSGALIVSVEHIVDGKATSEVVDPEQHVPELVDAYRTHLADEICESPEGGETARATVSIRIPGTRSSAEDLQQHTEIDSPCHLLVRLVAGDEATKNQGLNSVALVRGRGMVVRYWSRSSILVGARPFHAVLLAGEAAAASAENLWAEQFLRISEPPAHDRWEFNDDLREKYQRGAGARIHEFWGAITEELRKLIRPKEKAEEDGPDALRRLLQLSAPPEPAAPTATLRSVQARFKDGHWKINGKIKVNDRRKALVATPVLSVDPESGGAIKLPWSKLNVVSTSRGGATASNEAISIEANTSSVSFEASTATTEGLDLHQCRARIVLHVRYATE